MNNATFGIIFIDSVDYIVLDCKSGDPNRTIGCIVNTALGAITGIVLPFFILSGLACNALIVYISLIKQPNWTRQNVYISTIAIADSCSIFVNGFMWMFLAKGLPWLTNGAVGYVHLNTSNLACKFAKYFEYLCHLMASALFLLMVTDRALSLYFPFKFQNVTGKAAMKASAAVALVCFIFTIPIGILFHWILIENIWLACYLSYDEFSAVENAVLFYYTTLFYYPPTLLLALIFVANCFLIYKVRVIVSNRKKLQGSARDTDEGLVNTVICVSLSACLLISAAPTVFARIAEYILMSLHVYLDVQTGILMWGLHDIGMTLIIISQSTNWIFIMWKNVKFRRLLLATVTCKKAPEEVAVNPTS